MTGQTWTGETAKRSLMSQDTMDGAAGMIRPVRDCGDLDMVIRRDGTWLYRGSAIGRPALVKLFASVLRREADGSYWLVTPAERGRVTVEDAPFTAVEVAARGLGREQVLEFRTNIDDSVVAGIDHPLRVAIDDATGAPSPYVLVRPGLEARLTRAVYYELVDMGVEEEGAGGMRLGVWSDGVFFALDGSA